MRRIPSGSQFVLNIFERAVNPCWVGPPAATTTTQVTSAALRPSNESSSDTSLLTKSLSLRTRSLILMNCNSRPFPSSTRGASSGAATFRRTASVEVTTVRKASSSMRNVVWSTLQLPSRSSNMIQLRRKKLATTSRVKSISSMVL